MIPCNYAPYAFALKSSNACDDRLLLLPPPKPKLDLALDVLIEETEVHYTTCANTDTPSMTFRTSVYVNAANYIAENIVILTM